MIGYISSYETTGMVDGPGIRFVAFLSGCRLRCLYCHNPETWRQNDDHKMSSVRLMDIILKNKDYYQDGGVTFSGGEPLLQPDFLIEMLKLCKKKNFHTALDTAGVGFGRYDEILKYTDLVILDIKGTDNKSYLKITGQPIKQVEEFIEALNESNKPVWIRSVIVPNINDTKEYIESLNKYLKKINNIEKIELLPYRSFGKEKYEELNIEYLLKDVEDMQQKRINELTSYLEIKM